MPKRYMHEYLVKIRQLVHGISCEQALFGKFVSFKSRSDLGNQLFTMSQCYIHANMVKIRQPVHEISWKQESVMPTPTGSDNMPHSPSVGVHNWQNLNLVMPPISKKLREHIGFGLSVRPFIENRARWRFEISYIDSSWKNS